LPGLFERRFALRMPRFTLIFPARERYESQLRGLMRFRQQAATWQYIQALTRRIAADEARLRRGFWRKLGNVVANLPFAEDLLAAYYCAFDRQTPLHVKAVLVGAIAYFILPDDLIPDYIPVIGYTDDAAVVAAAVKLVSSHITAAHREAAGRMLAQLRDEAPLRPKHDFAHY
jgi:uncharacterized membrane protein YkvA (DUF1232 family)